MDTKQILAELDIEIARLTQVRALLTDKKRSRPVPEHGRISAEGRKRIAEAQRKRWAKAKRQAKRNRQTKKAATG